MPDCHKCQHNGHPTRRCIRCPGPSIKPANHGQRILSLDRLPPSEFSQLKYSLNVDPPAPMADFMRLWLRMPTKTRDLLAKVISDQPRSGAALARQLRVSRQAVHRRLFQAALKYPVLRSVIRLRSNATIKTFKEYHDKQGEIFQNKQNNTINTGVK